MIEYVWMRSLLSRSRFVCWLRLRGFVTFWVGADSLPNWVCGDAFPFEWNQIRFLIEIEGFITFWVEANSFTDWDWGDALPFELKQIRLLIEYAGMRTLLSRSKFFWWLSMCGCVPFWVEADSFADWDWGDSLPFKLIQFRLLIEYVGMS